MRLAGAALLLLLAWLPVNAEERGQADIALQGYYLGGSSQPLNDTSGLAVRFRYLLPDLGVLSGSLEGYGGQRRFRVGDNYVELRGLPWAGRSWTFTVGDFRHASTSVDLPLQNIFLPEIAARGLRIESAHGGSAYTFFFGQETVLTGPRLPFRIPSSQNLLGATARFTPLKRWQIAFRYLRLFDTPEEAGEFMFPGGGFRRWESISAQSVYSLTSKLRLFADTAHTLRVIRDTTSPGTPVAVSGLAGASFETGPVTVRANYVYQGADYLPLSGYYVGGRRGPYGEVRVRPAAWLELYGSANRYANNLENDRETATFKSTSTSAGLSLSLPWSLSANGQLTHVDFGSQSPRNEGDYRSNNRLASINLSRPFRRHTVRIGTRELRMRSGGRTQLQQAHEVEDWAAFSRFTVGGSVRLQQDRAEERRNTLFFRGSAQVHLSMFTFYGNMEAGNDLVNRTVFATSAYSTSSAGLSARFGRSWNLQVDTFRTRLIQDLNPESIFMLQSGGVFPSTTISRFGQWSFFFRLSRQVHWGGSLPAEAAAQLTARQAPLTGGIEGVVHETAAARVRPAAGIPVSLDGLRTALTDSQGRYQFADVVEGLHRVHFNMREMPAEFDPGTAAPVAVQVRPRRVSRADLEVLPLGSLHGSLRATDTTALEGVVIRLLPGARYTTTDTEGNFSFYNVREGDYQVTVEASSLPAGARLTSPGSAPVAVRVGVDLSPVHFDVSIPARQKPVRRVILQK